MTTAYEPVIGLEVHAQLKTQSKIFCGCSTDFNAKENENICPVCTGMPGSLPVLNKKAVEYAIKMALATHCTVQEQSIFSRKNYFYPDLPKNYQISQYDKPLAEHGYVEIDDDGQSRKIRLRRIHMEEDAGKNIHGVIASYINYNRSGIPLIEIVSEPDIRTSQEAGNYLRNLRMILRYLDICDGNMEEGSFRCDVNISVRPYSQKELGTRAEIKNINSFRFVEKAIEYEIERQKEILQGGGKIIQETRLWDSVKNQTISMRSKEEAHDYRYFPEPDLLPLRINEPWIFDVQKHMIELPLEKKKRFIQQYQLTEYDAKILVQEKELAQYFEEAVSVCKKPKLVSNWILSELLREISIESIFQCKISAKHLGELILLIDEGTISGKMAKMVFTKMLETGQSPGTIVEREGLVQQTDEKTISNWVDQVLQENPDMVKNYSERLLGFFVGQVMKKSHGKANPGIVNDLLKKKLGKK